MKGVRPGALLLPLLLPGCISPPVLEPPAVEAEVLGGEWLRPRTSHPEALGPGPSFLALAPGGPLALTLRVEPGPNCRAAGVWGCFRSPSACRGLVVTPARLRYIRREAKEEVTPSIASALLPPGTWEKGFTLEVKLGRKRVRGRLVGLTPPVSWHSPSFAAGRTVLYSLGPARFTLLGVRALTDPVLLEGTDQLLRHFPAREAGGTIGRALERSLAAVTDGNSRPRPADLAAAWLWTGGETHRKRLLAHPDRLAGPARLVAWLEAVRTVRAFPQDRASWESATRQLAAGMRGQEEDRWRQHPLAALVLPGRALFLAEKRLLGRRRKEAFRAERLARSRLSRLIDEGRCRRWPASHLLAALEWLDQVGERKQAMSLQLQRILAERHLVITPRGPMVAGRGGPDRAATLRWALHLAGGDPDRRRAATLAALAVGASEDPLPFALLPALLARLPALAPAGTGAILDTTGTLLRIDREGDALNWVTAGPSREVVLIGASRALLSRDGEQVTVSGPLVEVTHKEPECRLDPPR